MTPICIFIRKKGSLGPRGRDQGMLKPNVPIPFTQDSSYFLHQKYTFGNQGLDSIYSRQQLLPTLEVYIWKLGVGFHLLQTVVTSYISGIHLETRSWISFTPDSSYFLHQKYTFGNQEFESIYFIQWLVPTLMEFIW